jgi:hypothetical protein
MRRGESGAQADGRGHDGAAAAGDPLNHLHTHTHTHTHTHHNNDNNNNNNTYNDRSKRCSGRWEGA